MADNLKKTFTIEIAGVKESVTNLESLEDILVKMEKQVETINKNGGFSVVSKEANKNAKEAIDLAKAEQIAQGEVVSSYKDKQKALSTLGKEIKSMTVADGEAAKKQQEMIQQYNGLNDQLKRFDASMGNHQRNVGDYRGALKETTMQIKEMQGEMAQMLLNGIDKADPKFKALAQKAGELQDAIQDAREEVGRFASDTKKLDDVINIAQSATAAFELYKGAMSAFGIETEEAEKAMQKLVGAMSVIQSLQQLSNTLQEGSATAKLFSVALKATGAELVVNQVNAIKAAAAQEGLTKVQKVGAVASKTLGLALKAIPLMLVISLVATLITHWEDLVGWIYNTFPALKKTGGAFNTFKAIVVGVGKAIMHWLTNPIETLVEMLGHVGKAIKALFSGDFDGYVREMKSAVTTALSGIKKQFKGFGEAYNEGYTETVKAGLEEATLKTIEETNKQTQQQLKELKIQERNNKTYSKKYIDLQKKDFAERRKLAKGNKEELDKIKLEEMQFFADVEDKKTAAAKKGAADRTKVNKEAAKQAKEAAKEEEERQKKEREYRLKADEKLYKSTADYLQKLKQFEIEKAEAEVKQYESGPVEKYTEAVEKLVKKQEELVTLQRQARLQDFFNDYRNNVDASIEKIDEFIEALNAIVKKSQEYGKEVSVEMFAEFAKENKIFKNLTVDQYKYLYGIYIDYVKDGLKNKEQLEKEANERIAKQTIEINKKTINRLGAILKSTMIENEPKTYDFYNHLFKSVFDSDKRDKAIQEYKDYWKKVYDETKSQEANLLKTWDSYLESVKTVYGKDSAEYVAAQEEKKKALEEFYRYQKTAEKGSKGKVVSTKGRVRNASEINPNESRTKVNGNTNWSSLWDPDAEWYQNTEKLFGLMEDTVLGPAMDTFSMYMDFAIEETQARLEEVQEMHDEALEKVEASVDKIAELNESLKDSSNTNMEATKQQLADEQILYAQRLAEEQKLAQEERALQNKANEQQYQSRIMELKYQLVMGIANTALGASKALSQWGWPLGAIFAGVMTALGAVQTALIAKQIGALPKPKKLADGGLITGPSHKQGGIQVGRTGIEVEGGEAIINKRSTAKYLPLLDAINASGNGGKHTIANTDKRIRKFANGGTMNFENVDSNLRQNADTNKILNAMDKIDFNPVVSVVDFEKVQNRLVKVRSLAGR